MSSPEPPVQPKHSSASSTSSAAATFDLYNSPPCVISSSFARRCSNPGSPLVANPNHDPVPNPEIRIHHHRGRKKSNASISSSGSVRLVRQPSDLHQRSQSGMVKKQSKLFQSPIKQVFHNLGFLQSSKSTPLSTEQVSHLTPTNAKFHGLFQHFFRQSSDGKSRDRSF